MAPINPKPEAGAKTKTLDRLEILVAPDESIPETPRDVGHKHVHVLHVVQCANHHTPISGGVCTFSGRQCPVEESDIVIEE